jgi:hypothetical protein
LWTGAGEEPADQLNGEGEWQTLHQQRSNICPERDEHVEMGRASMAKFGGGGTCQKRVVHCVTRGGDNVEGAGS